MPATKKLLSTLTAVALGMSLFSSQVAQASLIDRGNGMLYDNVLNITWLQDADYAHTTGADSDGQMTWDEANNWAQGLVYGGYSNWRLASVNVNLQGCVEWTYAGNTNCGLNPVGGELAHMLRVNLDRNDAVQTNTNNWMYATFQVGLVRNLHLNGAYWSNLVSPSRPYGDAYYWNNNFGPLDYTTWTYSNGFVGSDWQVFHYYAWAVRDGDVTSSIPEPASLALTALALSALGLQRRRRSA